MYHSSGVRNAFLLMIVMCGCGKNEPPKQFTSMPASVTGISFANQLAHTEEFNIYTYRNFFNGGGVGIGDINNDGLPDIFFAGNMVSNRLYLNKGDFKFEDITTSAGVGSEGVWSTGISMADVNGDGWLDIYVCKSGKPGGSRRYNELYINNGNLTFTEKAKEYGLDFVGLSTHAAFFDMDNDGDLDCYLLTNSIRSVGGFDIVKDKRLIPDPENAGNKLLANTGSKFIDVSRKAGIYTSTIGFGLGITIGDINKDGWLDIYISNDFFERDYLYINQRNGTFREVLEQEMKSLSMGSMGADMADINNDGYPDVFVTEMLPRTNERIKTKAQFDSWNRQELAVANGYYYQYPRNMLQLNNGDGTFSEIGRLAAVEATDWSWSALIFDVDNDGWKDVFVANGIGKDLLDQDYVNFEAGPEKIQSIIAHEQHAILKLIDMMPSTPISNYSFHNTHDLRFDDSTADWGLTTSGFSNGSAYGDLDNDGDLDLVVNNINEQALIYRNENNLIHPDSHYLKFQLKGDHLNTLAIGAKITVEAGEQTIYIEQVPSRGFQSSVDIRPNVGLGTFKRVSRVTVEWPGEGTTVMENVAADQTIVLSADAKTISK